MEAAGPDTKISRTVERILHGCVDHVLAYVSTRAIRHFFEKEHAMGSVGDGVIERILDGVVGGNGHAVRAQIGCCCCGVNEL